MSANTFNPLAVERKQAEAHAGALRQAISADRDDLATKADIAALEGRIYRALWMQGAAIAGLILAAKLL